MKKGVIIGVAAVLVAVLVFAIVFVTRSFAPDFQVDGTYKAENGSVIVIQGDKLTCESDDSLSGDIEKIGFSTDYFTNRSIINFNYDKDSDGTLTVHNENGVRFFGIGDVQYNAVEE